MKPTKQTIFFFFPQKTRGLLFFSCFSLPAIIWNTLVLLQIAWNYNLGEGLRRDFEGASEGISKKISSDLS